MDIPDGGENIDEDGGPDVPGRTGRSTIILAAIAFAVLAVLAYVVIGAIGSDDALATEDTVREVLDERYPQDSLPSWCNGGCSATDDEWHAADDALVVAESLVADLIESGLDASFEAGPEDAYVVRISDGAGLDIAITGVGWRNASSAATGTAVWFTSVAVFDRPQVST